MIENENVMKGVMRDPASRENVMKGVMRDPAARYLNRSMMANTDSRKTEVKICAFARLIRTTVYVYSQYENRRLWLIRVQTISEC